MSRSTTYYFVFTVAGVPALFYQVAWQRVLSLYFGVDVYSTAVTVSSFMAGLGLGSLLGGRLADRTQNPARMYALVETGLAIFGASSLFLFSVVGRRLAGESLGVVACVSFALLLVPTFLMGMTLPLMVRVMVSGQSIGAPLARLYGLNTLGAAIGALLATYYVIGRFGLQNAVYIAAGLNALLAVVVLRIAQPNPGPAETATESHSIEQPLPAAIPILACLSGFIALGYEIVWYRLLTIVLHGTVYVFGTILFVYLLGIAAGSLAARRRLDDPNPVKRFARAQLLLNGYVIGYFVLLSHGSTLPGLKHLLSASFFTNFHPSPELVTGNISLFSIYSLLDIPGWSMSMMAIPAFAMGYGFPQLMRAAATSVGNAGTRVGQTYLANIIGATAGTLVVGFVFLERWGSEGTLLALAGIGLLTCLLAAVQAHGTRTELILFGILGTASILAFPSRGEVIRALHLAGFPAVEYRGHEDRSGVVALRKQKELIAFSMESRVLGSTRLYIDGSSHGRMEDGESVPDWGVRLAMARVPRPQRVLSIGLGDGLMCATALRDDSPVTELVIVELNEGLLKVLESTSRGRMIADSPKVRVVTDDGRRWLWANPEEKFDLIMMFPLHAAHAYYGNLFSEEFFQLVQSHLNPDGMLVARSVDLFSTARTLVHVFDHVVRIDQFSYVASRTPLRFDAGRLGFPPEEFTQRIEADQDTIRQFTAAAPLNRDLRPISEYYLTYRYVWTLCRPLDPQRIYMEQDRERFMNLIASPTEAVDRN